MIKKIIFLVGISVLLVGGLVSCTDNNLTNSLNVPDTDPYIFPNDPSSEDSSTEFGRGMVPVEIICYEVTGTGAVIVDCP